MRGIRVSSIHAASIRRAQPHIFIPFPNCFIKLSKIRSSLISAITIGTRVIGPALGFLLGALCTRVYVDPLANPEYEYSDPRWVGAWWLGMVFIAGFIVLLSILMFCFPRQIKDTPLPLPPKIKKEKSEPFFKDFFATIKRQLTNDILMWRTASSVLHLMPISGVYSYLPKYLEQQFRLPTHDANLVSGLGGILVMGLGIITSGVVILKLVPTARQVSAWTAATAAIYSVGMVVLMFVSCPEESYRSLTPGASNLSCSDACHCDGAPIERFGLHDKEYYPSIGFAVTGECGGGACKQIYAFIAIFAAIMFVHASGEVGAVLLIIRCTDKHDKAMAMGVIQFAIGVFGNVPCPIIFGAAVDAACRLRDRACGLLGGCASYDSDSMRHFYLGLSAGLMFLAFIMDMLVWSKAGRIDMNPADRAPDATPLPTAPSDTPL
ncbi:jg11869 [Pararge aegeria aegeria]|uniref:Jg11869 protein n=1 Tax=Pararge aegeria aegeria TaxID=348720 RepID=A0A8S4SEG0_9NEOP|nr:jg11869 [Pararge aegeria aegeria]